MKSFEQLSKSEQAKAVEKCANQLLQEIVEGTIHFNDKLNGDNLQARIDAAIEKSHKMQTPWFAGELVMDTCGIEINGMARCTAEDSLYSEPTEQVLSGIAA